jgi:23S rRNA (guanine2445-N2)-methyltransferase / 23S rRNA (guanine2069-N7)-methyltransferase
MRRWYATAPKNISPLLARELKELGARDLRESSAGVSFDASLATAYRICLWSRTANRVLLSLARFPAATPEQLYDAVRDIAWEDHLDPEGTLAVDCTVANAAISHSHYAALKTKDAIVDRLRERFGARPSVDTEQPDLRVNLHLRETQARLSLDLSGGSLHRRGYRAEGVSAPLKENLAAALLMLCDWPEQARAGAMLVDPMCGSGTLLVEAALMAGDVAPGLLRERFGFMRWKQHDTAAWNELIAEARARREAGRARIPALRGYDADAKAVRVAQGNVAAAGLKEHIAVEQRELANFSAEGLPAHGLLLTNPPYGERIGASRELPALYAQLGSILRRLPGWRAGVFTGNPELAAYLGMPSVRSDVLFNGPIECRLFHYEPRTERTAPEQPPPETTAGARMFANRLAKNLKHWEKWAKREDIDCYRIYDGDIPEYALAIDLYHGRERHVNVQEYQAPASIDAAKAQQRLQEALSVLPDVLEVPMSRVHFRVRMKQKGKGQYEKAGATREFVEVREGGLRFLVNFTDYLDTGLFLDHRRTRQKLRELANGARFLNLFAYTGTASVYAAAGGAVATTTVDMSHTYLDWARRNMALNGYTGAQHRFEQDDCFAWLRAHERERYDLIFLDPPTFSNSKRMDGTFDVQRDHIELLDATLRLLAPGGTLVFSNNFRRFRLDAAALRGVTIEDITRATLPRDFERNPRVHQCWTMRRA